MTMALEGGEGSASCPGHSLPTRKTRYPLYRRLGGPQGQSGQVRKISPPPGLNPHNVQPVASCYTDYATWPTQHVIAVLIMFSYKLKGISRAGPRHVGTSGRLIIWPLGRPIIWYPLKLQTFFDWGHSWWTFLRVHAQIVDNFEKKKKNILPMETGGYCHHICDYSSDVVYYHHICYYSSDALVPQVAAWLTCPLVQP